MLRASVFFFSLALVALFAGASGISGLSQGTGYAVLFVFLSLIAIGFVIRVVKTNRPPRSHP